MRSIREKNKELKYSVKKKVLNPTGKEQQKKIDAVRGQRIEVEFIVEMRTDTGESED